jgi:hypothetical protein
MHHPHNHHNIDSRSRSNGNNGRNTTTAYSTHDFSSLCDMNIFDIRYIFRFFSSSSFSFRGSPSDRHAESHRKPVACSELGVCSRCMVSVFSSRLLCSPAVVSSLHCNTKCGCLRSSSAETVIFGILEHRLSKSGAVNKSKKLKVPRLTNTTNTTTKRCRLARESTTSDRLHDEMQQASEHKASMSTAHTTERLEWIRMIAHNESLRRSWTHK